MLYKDMYNIFDAHCHIYPADIAPRAVAGVDAFYGGLPVKPRDGTVATLLETGREAGISRFLVHSVATSPHQVGSINRFIAREVANSGGTFVGLGALHPDSENLESDLHDLILLGLRGVKLHPDIQRFEADAPKAMRLYEICADAGLPVLMHTGDFRFDYSNPNRIANVLRSFPKLKLIGAHLGGWSVWDAAARTLPDFTNFMVDSSSCSRWLSTERMKQIIRAYGANRVLFGTDYPMWEQQEEIDALLQLDLTDWEYCRIFWDNAEALYTKPNPDPSSLDSPSPPSAG